MSKVRGHEPIIIEEFNGLWSRGDDESCPKDHMLLATNVQFIHSGLETRQACAPFSTSLIPGIDLTKILRVYNYVTQQGQTFLVLTEGGKFYHIVDPTVSNKTYLILTLAAAEDFAFIQIAGRAYISPFKNYTTPTGENYQLGLKNEFLYVYYRDPATPVGTTIPARPAAGVPPSNQIVSGGFKEENKPFLAYNSQVAGIVTQGHHAFGVTIDVTPNTGFIGPVLFTAGPSVHPVAHAPGDKSIELTGIPRWEIGTSGRVIYMTKANKYVPGGVNEFFKVISIPENMTTSIRINVADVDLTVPYVAGTVPSPVKTALFVENVDLSAQDPPVDHYCDLGFHLVGVVYETDSGYLTAPGPEYFGGTTYINESYAVKVSRIPVGPAGTIKRHLVSTKAIPEYNGDQKGYQFFFIPKGTIENNTETIKIVNYYDSDLVADASHLMENFKKIPAGVALSEYHARLILVGDPSYPKKVDGTTDDTTKPDNRSVAWVSAAGEPEAINQVDGLIITPLDGNPLTHCQDFRDNLYLFKQNRTYSVTDNQDEPTTWGPVETVDEGIGCPVHGIAEVLDSGGVNTDYLITASQSGLMLFNGIYARPELSWKIENIWNHFNKNNFHKIQLVNDSIRKRIWMTFPDDLTLMLLADYSNGLNPKDIRWALWDFDRPIINSIVLYKTDKLVLGTKVDQLTHLLDNIIMKRSKVWPPANTSGYPSDITPPPYAFTGVGGGPFIPDVGGGLVMLDPANKNKHDVFLTSGGIALNFRIMVNLRTAFLGG